MIPISKNDSIMDIVLKINHCEDKEVILQFSFGHPILHNHLSLKILKNKTEPKKLIIVTSDVSSKKIGKKLGIEYSIIKDPKFIEQQDILKHNFTFTQYLKYELNNYYKEFQSLIKQNKQVHSLMKYKYKAYNDKVGIGIFIVSFIFSIFLLLFIFYFAVNKTYVRITPEIKIETRWANFIFSQREQDSVFSGDNTIPISTYTSTITLTKDFSTTGIDNASTQKASGEIIVFNQLLEGIDLKNNTRVRREDGVEYTIDASISLPAATQDINGAIIPSQTTANITAKNYDAIWQFIWKRWNSTGSISFIIPGLPEELRSKIYAKTETDMSGGSNDYKTILTQEDIDKATEILTSQLKSEVTIQAKRSIRETNLNNNSSIDILDVSDAISYGEALIQIPDNIQAWNIQTTLTLTGTISARFYLFDKQQVINKLKKTINDSLLSDVEELIRIDKDSLRVSHIISSQDDPIEIKATSEVAILLQHNFVNPDDSFVQQLKYTIMWMEPQQAEWVLRNNEKIQDVEVYNRPFFIKKIPSIPSNIIFQLEE